MRTSLGIDIGGSSVKLAALEGESVRWTGQTKRYDQPSREALTRAIRELLDGRFVTGSAVGICVPGTRDRSKRVVTNAVNIPALNGLVLDELIEEAVGERPGRVEIATDAVACAYDLYRSRKLKGRLLALAIGTGVGGAVLDDGVPLLVDGDSSGHFGQLDVSIEGHPVIGPDGGAGGLEGYVGTQPLVNRYGHDMPKTLAALGAEDPPIQALARAIRIAHAIYCPHHVALTGGLGIRMAHLLPVIRSLVEKDLTNIARKGWTLISGDDDFHAAKGVARMAGNNFSGNR